MTGRLFLPALQGKFGSWLYYSALVRLGDLRQRVNYAAEIHKSRGLGELIQRRLDNKKRRQEIADFLLTNGDRFFNALVVAVAGGEPQWHPLLVNVLNDTHKLEEIREVDREAIGYLELTGTERLFALDGQHRLAGIRDAVARNPAIGEERVTVVFVSSNNGPAGLRRTRDLFIMLNKHAVPVKKPDIIALDESDLAAIVTRRLVDRHPWFSREQIDLYKYTNSLRKGDTAHLTTLGNLYDVVNIAIRHVMSEPENAEELKVASRLRLPETRIDFFEQLTVDFFTRLSKIDPQLQSYFSNSAPPTEVLEAARDAKSPHILFRPIGLLTFTRVLRELRKELSVAESFRRLAKAPLLMTQRPYEGVIWNASRGIVQPKGFALGVQLLAYQLGANIHTDKLKTRYAEFTGQSLKSVRLPPRLPGR